MVMINTRVMVRVKLLIKSPSQIAFKSQINIDFSGGTIVNVPRIYLIYIFSICSQANMQSISNQCEDIRSK